MKTLKNLKNAKELNKKEQLEIKGGVDLCLIIMCIPEDICIDGKCVRRRDPIFEM
jgi:hypothetical protein